MSEPEPDSDSETMDAAIARVGAVKRFWFLPLALGIVVAMPLGVSIALARLSPVRDGVAPLFALVAGLLAAASILGHLPAYYREFGTGEYTLYWLPRTTSTRVRFAVIAVVLVAAGVGIDFLSQ